jgi:hypothetical protein
LWQIVLWQVVLCKLVVCTFLCCRNLIDAFFSLIVASLQQGVTTKYKQVDSPL